MTDERKAALDALIAGDADLCDVPYSEQDAWGWLHSKYKDHPNDRDFGSDDMVDAFMEGRSTLPRDIAAFATALETGLDYNVMKHLDVRMCCDGHHCGCRGSTVGEYLASELRTASARIKGDKDRATQSSAPAAATFVVQCDTCCGSGEIVTDWDRYLRAHAGDKGDEAVADCPDCGGNGSVEITDEPEAHRLRTVLQYIADAAYVDHQSGNANFEYLQNLARVGLTYRPEEPNHDQD